MFEQKRSVILLHGFLGEPADWDPVVEFIENQTEQVHFFRPDLAVAATRSELQTVGDFARWLNGIVKIKLQAEKPLLAGYSMGGRLALSTYLLEPHLYGGLLLLSTHPGLESESEQARRRKSDEELSEKLLTEPWSKFWTEWNSQEVLKPGVRPIPPDVSELNKEKPQRLEKNRQAWARAARCFSLGNQDTDLDLLKMHANDKVTVMTGTEDAKYSELWGGVSQPPWRYRTLLGAGHRLLHEAPNDVAFELLRMLTGL